MKSDEEMRSERSQIEAMPCKSIAELVEKLKAIQKWQDEHSDDEVTHIMADQAVQDFIPKEAADIWENLRRWYA